ncbi:MAG TPA: SMP-30/gluconolactonase/LRE family protein [Polyangiaceae bacterium]
MRRATAELVFSCRSTLGEGSVWDCEQSCLYWVDIHENKVYRFDPRRRSNLAYDVGANVGTVVVAHGGNLLLALRHQLAWLDPETGRVCPLVAPAPPVAGIRFNDGKCDPEGRFWVGTMVEKGPSGAADLYCVQHDLSIAVKLTGLTISNGLAWHGKAFYHIDTATKLIRRFDYDPASAAITAPSVVADFRDGPGSPDGMCLDDQGMLWVALFGGAAVVRIDPATGNEVFRVELPTTNVTSCAFGGEDLDELYITTARVGLSDAALAAEPHAGSLFRAKLPFRGVPSSRFARAFE